MTQIYFAATAKQWPLYRDTLAQACARLRLDVTISPHAHDPAAVDYIIFEPDGVIQDFTPFTNCKAVLNLWAVVERLVTNPTLRQPLCRMVDPAMTESMSEYVTGHVLRYHLGLDGHILNQDGIWRHDHIPPIARKRPVGILGMGQLGQAAARALQGLNFPVMGWSRSEKSLPGIETYHGEAGLAQVLSRAEILVLLMPRTPQTENILNTTRLALMPRGAKIINPGRGPLIDDDALLSALNSGQIGHATLDVFRTEPLPAQHPFWGHPNVTVTPHIAADTHPDTAAQVLAENIRRGEAGLAFLHLVDRTRGY